MVVRKQLKPMSNYRPQEKGKRGVDKEETTCLRLLRRLQHPNIVKLLGSYSYKGTLNFLFPYLDQDLSKFLKLDSRPKSFEDDHTFFGALYGLASALENVHVLKLNAQEHGVEMASIGYHHDLRPENVLIEGSTFLLADFGLSKIKDGNEVSQTEWKAGAGDYIAPECLDENLKHQRVGRAIDVWAFGCLMAEVLTYLELGKTGLDEFRTGRASAEFFPNWEDPYFFTRDGLRPAVSRWLLKLASQSQNLLIPEGVKVVFWILQTDPYQRPKASKIVPKLSILSIRAHFLAVKHAFMDHIANTRENDSESVSFMKLWFEKERLSALETFCDSPPGDSSLVSLLEQVHGLHDRLRNLFIALLEVLRGDHKGKIIDQDNDAENHVVDLGQSFDAEVQSIVQGLWELFPINSQRKMEFAWRQKLGHINNAEELRREWMRPGAVSSPQYDELSALAKMRVLRLQFLHRETSTSSKEYIRSYKDVNSEDEMDDHTTCLYNGQQALIEWEYYSSKWEQVSTTEKAELMALKAEGLGVTPKPATLKILDCFGFVEKLSGRHGYGFLYAFPSENTGRLTSLLSLLVQDMTEGKRQRQPLLGDKFRLAATLGKCLFEIHVAGWVHENINSHNVVFFKIASQDLQTSPTALDDPYVVDFRHSRPDSRVWYTQGPSDDEYVDYRHPAYNRGNRFRQVYDYYSLAIVLLEIGLWSPLSYMTAKYRTLTPEELRDVLVNKYVPRLGPRMGPVYRDAVRFCLRGDFDVDRKDDESEVGDLAQFTEKVVEPLEELAQLPLI